jgi:hypothetical protein
MMKKLLLTAYIAGDLATFVFLVFFDAYRYNAWNWLVVVPIDFFLAIFWPLYWVVWRPLFGG